MLFGSGVPFFSVFFVIPASYPISAFVMPIRNPSVPESIYPNVPHITENIAIFNPPPNSGTISHPPILHQPDGKRLFVAGQKYSFFNAFSIWDQHIGDQHGSEVVEVSRGFRQTNFSENAAIYNCGRSCSVATNAIPHFPSRRLVLFAIRNIYAGGLNLNPCTFFIHNNIYTFFGRFSSNASVFRLVSDRSQRTYRDDNSYHPRYYQTEISEHSSYRNFLIEVTLRCVFRPLFPWVSVVCSFITIRASGGVIGLSVSGFTAFWVGF